MGGAFRGVYWVFDWGLSLFAAELHSLAVPQALKTGTYWRLSSAEEEGFVLAAKCSLWCCEYHSLIPGNVWSNSYTWLSVSIFHRTHEKCPLWEWKKPTGFFSDLIVFKIQEETSKRLFSSSCIIINYHTKKINQTHIQNLKILWSLPLGKTLLVRSRWGWWTVPDFTAWTDNGVFCAVKTSVFCMCVCVCVCSKRAAFCCHFKE